MVAKLLTALTRKDKNTEATVSFVCMEQSVRVSFQSVKSMLISAPLIHLPDLNKPFFLWTDACSKGFGALLNRKVMMADGIQLLMLIDKPIQLNPTKSQLN